MANDQVLFEQRGAAGIARINREKELNCLGPAALDGFDAILDRVERDETCRALVLTGTGRAFSAGGDLAFINTLPENDRQAAAERFIGRVLAFMDRLEAFPKPVIAAVNGIATGGGLELLLCCDLIIAAESARIGDAHANYGLVPGGGASARLPRKIGPMFAKYLFFTGDLLPAARFTDCGLISQVVPGEDLMAAADALVAKIAAKSPLGLRRVKALANASLEQPTAQAIAAERMMNALHASSYDFIEGVRAFNEKRAPVFEGR